MLEALVKGPLSGRAAGAPLVRRVLKDCRPHRVADRRSAAASVSGVGAGTPRISATILAALGQIELHLSARAPSAEVAGTAVEAAVRQVCAVLEEDVFSTSGEPMEAVVGDLLVSRGYRIALAESCTGGLVTSRLTDVPGSSRYVDRGWSSTRTRRRSICLAFRPS
jgi:nicotinamide-nucleotide amidase